MQMLFVKDLFPVHIPETGRCTLLWSGGVDSTTLYFLLKRHKMDVRCLAIKDRVFEQRIQEISQFYGIEFEFVNRSSRDADIRKDVIALCKQEWNQDPERAFYIAVTQNMEFVHSYTPKRPAAFCYLPKDFLQSKPEIIMPFVNSEKTEVIQLASKLNINIQATHSCTESYHPCEACYACIERSTAIRRVQSV